MTFRERLSAALVLILGLGIVGALAPAPAARADEVVVTNISEFRAAMASGPEIVVLGNTISGVGNTFDVPANVTKVLDLDGHTFDAAATSGHVAYVGPGAHFTIRDTAGGGYFIANAVEGYGGIVGGPGATIRIESGHVTVRNADDQGDGFGGSAGIGGSARVEIAGGVVTSSAMWGAAIGADPGSADVGAVVISGGEVYVVSAWGAAIGGGATSAGVDVTITAGTVRARSDKGAAIGGGLNGQPGTVTIAGGDIETLKTSPLFGATSLGAAIGAGGHSDASDGDESTHGASIVITGGRTFARGFTSPDPAIGGPSATIQISGGLVQAIGDSGPALGGFGATLDAAGGRVTANTVGYDFPAIRGTVLTLHGTPLPTSHATSGGSGIEEAAVPYATAPLESVSYDTVSRDAGLAFAINPYAEIQFYADVVFDAAGASPSPETQTVLWDAAAEEPPVPTRASYTFDGWRLDSASGDQWDFEDPITGPVSLVAAWLADPPTISGTPTSGVYGDTYHFAMTVTGPEATVALSSGELPPGLSVSASGVISGTPTEIGSFDAVLTVTNPGGSDDVEITIAVAAGAAQTVSFDANGGTPTPPAQAVPRGETAAQPAVEPVRAGCVFDGWRVGSAAGEAYDFANPVDGPLTLVAAWLELPTITGTLAGGTFGEPYTSGVTLGGVGTTVAVTAGALPPGLALDADGSIEGTPTEVGSFDATLTATNSAGTTERDITIVIAAGEAQTVTFDSNGGVPALWTQGVPRGLAAEEPADPTRDGYTFGGWHVGTVEGPLVDFDEIVTAPFTLVASWNLLAPTITGAETANVAAGEPFIYTPVLEGAEVTVTAEGLPAGLEVDEATGVISGVPEGPVGDSEVILTAENGAGSDSHTVVLTLEHGVAASFSAEASDLTPKQGDTIVVTVTALDEYGNEWDASEDALIESDNPKDKIVGNSVTFPTASPHVLTVSVYELPAQTITVEVEPAPAELGATGSEVPWVAALAALLALIAGAGVVLARRAMASAPATQ